MTTHGTPRDCLFNFGPPLSHRNAPKGTSEVAAEKVASRTERQRAEVLAYIVSTGERGATDAETEAFTGIRAQSVSPRRGELAKAGLVRDTGTRRKTPRGCPAAVWVATQIEKGNEHE